MTRLQDDLLGLYNDLVNLSKATLENKIQQPIKVTFEENMNSLSFEQAGKKIYSQVPLYYGGKIKEIKDTWLLPKDYDYLMGTLSQLLQDGILIKDRVCISPEVYGFDVYLTDQNTLKFKNGPVLLGQVRFCSGNSWLFKKLIHYKYDAL